jgi:squalene-hopene/tetraprenyl-beta-curcumene cyclase
MKGKAHLTALFLLILAMPWGCNRGESPGEGPAPARGEAVTDPPKAARDAIRKGLEFLEKAQQKPGSGDWGDPGLSAIVMHAFLQSPENISPATHKFIWKGLETIAGMQKPDGSIYREGNATYVTSVSLKAFALARDERFKDTVEKAKRYLLDTQVYEEGNRFTGGFGYEDRRKKAGGPYADIVNTEFALEALHHAGVPKDNPVWKRSLAFFEKTQHLSERNPAPWVTSSKEFAGGFIYYPGKSHAGEHTLPNGKKILLPYGSVTYAGIKSMIYANLTKDDPRVKAAVDWMRKHWTLEENPGFDVERKDRTLGLQGLYYYFVTFSKTLHALGGDFIKDAKGATHNWREELIRAVVPLQQPDGSWINENNRWWEDNPLLATSYAVIALSFCLKK